MENSKKKNKKKNSGKNKNKLRTIYHKNHENFKNSKPRVQFYWFLYKKSVNSHMDLMSNMGKYKTKKNPGRIM